MISIGDDTNHSIDVTVWGELSQAPFKKDTIVAFKSCRISDFSGRSLNASSDKADIVLEVEHPEATMIKEWAKENSDMQLKNLSAGMRKEGNEVTCSIAEMVMLVEQDASIAEGKPAFFKVDCFISFIPGVIDGQRVAYYMGCTVCKKKVTEAPLGFECQRCDQVFEEALPAWNFTAKINDHSGDSVYLGCLGESAAPLMDMDASQYHQAVCEDPTKIEELVKSSYFKPWTLVIRAKLDTYGGT